MSILFSTLAISLGLAKDEYEHRRDIEPKDRPQRYYDAKKRADDVIAQQRAEWERIHRRKCPW